MKTRAPSPALVISFIALLVAFTATAYAATKITKSSQIKNGIVSSSDIKNKTIKGKDIAKSTIDTTNLSKSTLKRIDKGPTGSESAVEVKRSNGPQNQPPNQGIKVLDETVPAGAYIVTAKVIQSAFPAGGLLTPQVVAAPGHCKLDAAGSVDDSSALVAASNVSVPGVHVMQITRTFSGSSNIALICDAGLPWSAKFATIIAHKVGTVSDSTVPNR